MLSVALCDANLFPWLSTVQVEGEDSEWQQEREDSSSRLLKPQCSASSLRLPWLWSDTEHGDSTSPHDTGGTPL